MWTLSHDPIAGPESARHLRAKRVSRSGERSRRVVFRLACASKRAFPKGNRETRPHVGISVVGATGIEPVTPPV